MAAKKKARSSSATSNRRGGRRPGTWVHVQPEEIRAYRDSHGLSRARLAAALGVSATSIQNWELGKVASVQAQLQLRELMDGKGSTPRESSPEVAASRVLATARIVSAYVGINGEVTPDQVPELIRVVRAALEE